MAESRFAGSAPENDMSLACIGSSFRSRWVTILRPTAPAVQGLGARRGDRPRTRETGGSPACGLPPSVILNLRGDREPVGRFRVPDPRVEACEHGSRREIELLDVAARRVAGPERGSARVKR